MICRLYNDVLQEVEKKKRNDQKSGKVLVAAESKRQMKGNSAMNKILQEAYFQGRVVKEFLQGRSHTICQRWQESEYR